MNSNKTQHPLRGFKRQEDFKLVSHEIAYNGYFKIEKYRFQHRLFQGGFSNIIQREIFERGQAAAVLPYDPTRDEVVLIEQFRIGALKDKQSPWLLEIVAGIIEDGETPEDLVMREAKEEAGVTLKNLTRICHFWVSPGGTTESVTLYCGEIDSSQAGGIHGLDEENEDIRVHILKFDEAYQMIQTGQINNPPAIIALQWLMLKRLQGQ